MEIEALKWFGSLGVGGVLAGGIFMLYRADRLSERKDALQEKERLEKREDRLVVIIERQATASERLAVLIEKLDETLTEHHRFAASWTERLSHDVGQIHHDVVNLLNRAPRLLP